MSPRTFKVLALAAAATLSAATVAQAADPTQQELLQQVKQLQAKVDAMEARQNAASDTATVNAVLDDAHRRSQLLANNADGSAGHDDAGFYIRMGPDFTLRPALQLQFRNVSTWADNKKNGGSDFENGFEWRRVRFLFSGNAFGPDLTYKVEYDTNRVGGGASLLETWAQYRFNADIALRAGQFKDPVFREEMVSSTAQLFADKSLVNAIVGSGLSDYVQGVDLIYGADASALHGQLALHDGARSLNTDFTDHFPVATPPAVTHDTTFGVSGRAEWKAMGQWKDYSDFTARALTKDSTLLVFGAGTDVTQKDNATQYLSTVDAQFKSGRFAVFAALDGDYYDLRNTGGPGSRFDWGGIVQAGYMLNPAWELLGRYGYIRLDSDFTAAGEDVFHELGLGLNWYLGKDGELGHRARITFDGIYLPNGAPADVTSIGVLGNPGESEFIFRVQLQLLI